MNQISISVDEVGSVLGWLGKDRVTSPLRNSWQAVCFDRAAGCPSQGLSDTDIDAIQLSIRERGRDLRPGLAREARFLSD